MPTSSSSSFFSVLSLPFPNSHPPPPPLPAFALCLTTYRKYRYRVAVPRCGCSFAEGLRSLSELMSHMCGGSGPHQSWRRLAGRSPFFSGRFEGAQRAGNWSTCWVHRPHRYEAKQSQVSVPPQHTPIASRCQWEESVSHSQGESERLFKCVRSQFTLREFGKHRASDPQDPGQRRQAEQASPPPGCKYCL